MSGREAACEGFTLTCPHRFCLNDFPSSYGGGGRANPPPRASDKDLAATLASSGEQEWQRDVAKATRGAAKWFENVSRCVPEPSECFEVGLKHG